MMSLYACHLIGCGQCVTWLRPVCYWLFLWDTVCSLVDVITPTTWYWLWPRSNKMDFTLLFYARIREKRTARKGRPRGIWRERNYSNNGAAREVTNLSTHISVTGARKSMWGYVRLTKKKIKTSQTIEVTSTQHEEPTGHFLNTHTMRKY